MASFREAAQRLGWPRVSDMILFLSCPGLKEAAKVPQDFRSGQLANLLVQNIASESRYQCTRQLGPSQQTVRAPTRVSPRQPSSGRDKRQLRPEYVWGRRDFCLHLRQQWEFRTRLPTLGNRVRKLSTPTPALPFRRVSPGLSGGYWPQAASGRSVACWTPLDPDNRTSRSTETN
jgi:hypothetical protein